MVCEGGGLNRSVSRTSHTPRGKLVAANRDALRMHIACRVPSISGVLGFSIFYQVPCSHTSCTSLPLLKWISIVTLITVGRCSSKSAHYDIDSILCVGAHQETLWHSVIDHVNASAPQHINQCVRVLSGRGVTRWRSPWRGRSGHLFLLLNNWVMLGHGVLLFGRLLRVKCWGVGCGEKGATSGFPP